MNYIDSKTLEILTALIISGKEVKVHKSWINDYPRVFKEMEDLKNNNLVHVKEEQSELLIFTSNKENLEQFLLEYLNLYKDNKLTTNSDVPYFSYMKNVSCLIAYIENHLDDAVFIFDTEKIVNSSIVGNNFSRIRMAEFVLDLYFNFKEQAKICSASIKKIGLINAYKFIASIHFIEDIDNLEVVMKILTSNHKKKLQIKLYYDEKINAIFLNDKKMHFRSVGDPIFKLAKFLVLNPNKMHNIEEYCNNENYDKDAFFPSFKKRVSDINKKFQKYCLDTFVFIHIHEENEFILEYNTTGLIP